MWCCVFNSDVIGGNLMASGGQTKVTVTFDHHLWILRWHTMHGEKVSSNFCHRFIGRVYSLTFMKIITPCIIRPCTTDVVCQITTDGSSEYQSCTYPKRTWKIILVWILCHNCVARVITGVGRSDHITHKRWDRLGMCCWCDEVVGWLPTETGHSLVLLEDCGTIDHRS
jgi:hypothetical protein